jgi:hypothetical protein
MMHGSSQMITIKPTTTPGMLECRFSGRLTQADYEQSLAPALEQAFSTSDHIRMLVIVDGDLSGMDAGAVWADSKMGLSHWRGFDRIAVATDVGFFRAASRAFAPLMPCPVQVFAHADVDAARLWLRESLGTIHAAELAPGTMELRLLGELDPDAYTRANEALAAHVTQGEEFRLLLDLCEFDGWQGPAAMAAHLHTVMAHAGQAKRIAMVGTSTWQRAVELVGKRILAAKVKYFDADKYPEAREWVLEPVVG